MYFHRSAGISALSMKKIVLVHFTRPGIPWEMRPSSFLYDFIQRARYFGSLMRWQYSMRSPLSSLRARAKTSFRYWRHTRVRCLVVCQPISKLSKIASQVRWRKDFLLLVYLSAVASLLASTLWGVAVSASLIYWRFMSRAAICGEQWYGAALWTSGVAV